MMNSSTLGILISIILYLGLVISIGAVLTKRNKNAGDFYLGGRKLGPFVTAMSAEASDMSGWLLMGLPGVAYLTGVADAAWTAIGLAIGTYVNWLIVAKRLRCYSQINGAITLPEFFSNRYNDQKKIILGIAALVIIVFFVPYTASGFAACGKLFHSLFGISYTTAMLFSAAVIILYTTLGGFLAASTTDFIQGIVMSIALLIVLCFGVFAAGGFDVVMANANAMEGYLSFTATHNVITGETSPYSALTIASMLAWGLGYFGMPHVLLRFMAIEDKNKLKLSRRVATSWVVISLAVAVFIGIVGYSMSLAGVLPILDDPETIIVQISRLLSTYGFGLALIGGLILAGILASTMSTSDSQLLAASSSVSENILKGTFGIKMSDKTTVIVARTTVVCIAIIAAFLARNPNSSVFNIVSFSWAGFGAAFGPLMLFSLFWKRTTLPGAIAGMLSGGAMVFIWEYLISPMGGVWGIYELLPSFIVSSIFIVVVSLLTKAPGKKVTDDYDKYQEQLHK